MVERQLPPLVDPKELLVKNFERIQVGLLAEEPSPELMLVRCFVFAPTLRRFLVE